MTDSTAGLSFERVEREGETRKEGPVPCANCGEPVRGAYYQLKGAVICLGCRRRMIEVSGSPMGRFLRATLFGVGAAALGAGIWYGVSKVTGYEFGLVAIVIGLLVGGAVRIGSRRRGGWLYQALAMFLTYASIVSTYVPYIVEAAMEQDGATSIEGSAAAGVADLEKIGEGAEATVPPESPRDASNESEATRDDVTGRAAPGLLAALIGIVLLFAIAFAAPFLAGFENFMGWILIAIGLYEAWKLNRREELVFEGPFRLAGAPASYVPETPPPPIAP